MYNVGTSLNRRKHRRKVTKVFRELNKNITNDDLWRGRFIARIVDEQWYEYFDGSGACLAVYFELIDKKTGLRKLCHQEERLFFDGHVWWDMNDFITKDVNPWGNEERFWSDKYGKYVFDEIDWNDVKIEPWSFKRYRKFNWWPGKVFDSNEL